MVRPDAWSQQVAALQGRVRKARNRAVYLRVKSRRLLESKVEFEDELKKHATQHRAKLADAVAEACRVELEKMSAEMRDLAHEHFICETALDQISYERGIEDALQDPVGVGLVEMQGQREARVCGAFIAEVAPSKNLTSH